VAVILSALAPIYFVLLLGCTAGKRGVVKSVHIGGLDTVVMSYALPASLNRERNWLRAVAAYSNERCYSFSNDRAWQ
jgi:hypothetical protein